MHSSWAPALLAHTTKEHNTAARQPNPAVHSSWSQSSIYCKLQPQRHANEPLCCSWSAAGPKQFLRQGKYTCLPHTNDTQLQPLMFLPCFFLKKIERPICCVSFYTLPPSFLASHFKIEPFWCDVTSGLAVECTGTQFSKTKSGLFA